MSQDLIEAINQYGFPIIAAMGLAYFVYYVWKWVTTEIKPVLGEASTTLIALIDRIRMLDNDMIRLNQKIYMILEFKEQYEEGYYEQMRAAGLGNFVREQEDTHEYDTNLGAEEGHDDEDEALELQPGEEE